MLSRFVIEALHQSQESRARKLFRPLFFCLSSFLLNKLFIYRKKRNGKLLFLFYLVVGCVDVHIRPFILFYPAAPMAAVDERDNGGGGDYKFICIPAPRTHINPEL